MANKLMMWLRGNDEEEEKTLYTDKTKGAIARYKKAPPNDHRVFLSPSVRVTPSRRLRTSGNTERITITMGQNTSDAIAILAKKKGITKSAAVNYLVSRGLAMEALELTGTTVRLVEPDGTVHELVRGEETAENLTPAYQYFK